MLCLQETKVANFSVTMANDLMGSSFDYVYLPPVGVTGGALVAWRRDLWSGSHSVVCTFLISIYLWPLDHAGTSWCLTNVCGPTSRWDKAAFLCEIRDFRAAWSVETSTSSIWPPTIIMVSAAPRDALLSWSH